MSLLFIDASCQSVDGAATNRLSVDNSVDGVQSDNENTQKEDDDASDPLKCQEADDQSLTSENGADSQSDSDLILASSHADGTVRIWTLEVINNKYSTWLDMLLSGIAVTEAIIIIMHVFAKLNGYFILIFCSAFAAGSNTDDTIFGRKCTVCYKTK